MTFASIISYIIANIIGMILYTMYRPKPTNGDQSLEVDEYQYSRKMRKKPSLLAILGIQDNSSRYFHAFEDHFQSFDEVSRACKRAGLEKCGLIFGVDFTASNEWQGRKTFSGNSLHKLMQGKIYNPYQKVISIIGRTVEPFDDDNLIPAFGFGDSETKGDVVFPFISDGSPCCGFSEVLDCYSKIASKVTLSGPTNYSPIINKAIDIVKERKEFHILLIVADGQITEEKETVEAIVEASNYPLSIVLVGVGDGPWGLMQEFDDRLTNRKFDNFQFVNYHFITCKAKRPETKFALHVMMEIPDQFKTVKSLGYLNANGEDKV